MTKIIFSRDAYVASMTRTYMSCDKMSYASARRRAVHDANHNYWVKQCDGKEVIVDDYGYRYGDYLIGETWCIEVTCND